MDHTDPNAERLTNLEIKSSFADDLLDAINQTLYRQQQEIDQLRLELLRLREQSAPAPADISRSARDELPPHY